MESGNGLTRGLPHQEQDIHPKSQLKCIPKSACPYFCKQLPSTAHLRKENQTKTPAPLCGRRGAGCDSTLPPMCASWYTSQPPWILAVKLPNQLRVLNASSGHPGVLLWVIPLPVHQVWYTSTTASNIHKPPHSVYKSTIQHPGWRQGMDRGQVHSPSLV